MDREVTNNKDTEQSPITVVFKTDLAPNGEIQMVHIWKGERTIGLTVEQAKSLANEILKRL